MRIDNHLDAPLAKLRERVAIGDQVAFAASYSLWSVVYRAINATEMIEAFVGTVARRPSGALP